MKVDAIEVEDVVRTPTADMLRRLESIRHALDHEDGIAIEVYHRASVTLRATRRGRSVDFQRGRDDGLAVRTRSSRDGGVAFAACSGSGREAVRWALARCLAARDTACPDAGWPADTPGDLLDHDDTPLPSPEDLTGWLDEATDRLAEARGGSCESLETWVEAAATVESWVADPGLRASRLRIRGWAVARMRAPDGGPTPKPLVVAARRWPDLPTEGWSSALDDRWSSSGPAEAPPGDPMPVLFAPECSAVLVSALVEAAHLRRPDQERPIGRAWSICDDPQREEAVFGGKFDDCGFPTRRTTLADGQLTRGALVGQGQLRRPSFRDRPAPRASHLVVTTEPEDPPSRCVLVSALNVHLLDGERWVLEVDGAILDRGRMGKSLRTGFISVAPTDLIARCVAAVGPSRCSHRGVRTPALVFDGLRIE